MDYAVEKKLQTSKDSLKDQHLLYLMPEFLAVVQALLVQEYGRRSAANASAHYSSCLHEAQRLRSLVLAEPHSRELRLARHDARIADRRADLSDDDKHERVIDAALEGHANALNGTAE